MSFLRHKEIYQSDEIRSIGSDSADAPLTHRADEFPVGYSSEGCSPAVPPSASPTVVDCASTVRQKAKAYFRSSEKEGWILHGQQEAEGVKQPGPGDDLYGRF